MTSASSKPIVALAGGVGAARFLRGLVRAVPAEDVAVIVNTGDDRRFYGVHVSPDIDIVTYTLAGRVDRQRGFGLEGDTFALIEALGALGHETWFRLGDADFATCQHRSLRLAEGAGLAAVTDEIRGRFGVASQLLPMSEDPCPTLVELSGGESVHFEEYLVRDGAPSDVEGVDLSAARAAQPGPGVLEALRGARSIVFCPSNPVVSIGPILALPGVREALRESSAPIVAISPIVAGAPVKGPADSLLRGVGAEVSARGVARLYRDVVDGFVIDTRDSDETADVTAACAALDPSSPGAETAVAVRALVEQVIEPLDLSPKTVRRVFFSPDAALSYDFAARLLRGQGSKTNFVTLQDYEKAKKRELDVTGFSVDVTTSSTAIESTVKYILLKHSITVDGTDHSLKESATPTTCPEIIALNAAMKKKWSSYLPSTSGAKFLDDYQRSINDILQGLKPSSKTDDALVPSTVSVGNDLSDASLIN